MPSSPRRRNRVSQRSSFESLEQRNLLDGKPLAVSDQFAVSEDVALQIAAPGVLLNDVGGGPLTATVTTNPQHGDVKLAADGSFHYQPDANFFGEDSFTYQASDGKASSTPATVKITVLPVPDGPAVPQPDTYFARQDTPLLATGLGLTLAETGFNDATGIGAAAGDNLPYALGGDIAGQGGGETGWVGPWVQNNGTVAKVSNDSLEGDGALMLLPGGLTARQWQTPDANAPFTLEMRMKFTPSAYISLYLFDAENSLTEFTAEVVGGPQLNIDESGNVGVVDGADAVSTGFKVEPGQWHAITFQVDPATHSYRFFFDHAEALNAAPFDFRGAPAKIDAIAFIPQVSGEGILVDCLQIFGGHQTPGVLANELNVDALPLTAQLEAAPAHAAAFKLNADGTFEYTPAAGFIGPDTFTYRLHDNGKVSDPVLVTILVEDVLHAPQAKGDAFTLEPGTSLTVTDPLLGLLANDSDADGDALVVQLVDGPAHGQLKLSDNGTFVYTPSAGFVGADQFTYRAFDGKLASDTTTVELTVAKIDRSPVAVDDSYTVDEDGVLEVDGPASHPKLSADFSGSALPDWLEGSGFQVADGVVRREGSPGPLDRAYLRTKDGGYLDRDFIAEVSYTTSPTQDASILFFGLGGGTLTPGGAFGEPVQSVFLRLHTPTTSDGHVGISNAPAGDTAVLGHVTEPGLHRARLEKLGQTLKVSVDANYDGHFIADLSYTIDNLAAYAPFLNSTNAHLFFGTALPTDSFDDFKIFDPATSSVLANDKYPEPGPAPAADVSVPGATNLWLAGMPDGATASVSDVAPAQSPPRANGVAVVPGQVLRFSATGGVSNGVAESSTPDGQNTFVQHGSGAQNGIANIFAPLNSLIGVFLDDTSPAGKIAPQALDFRPTSANVPNGLNYGEISPVLRQPFFIGDGLGPDGTPQQVKVPTGAKRLFLAAMDSNASFNNSGDFAVKVLNTTVLPTSAVLVTGPAHGQVELDADGSFRYTPAPDYFGPDSFQYKIASRYGDSAPATVSIIVQPTLDPPQPRDDAYLVRQDTPLATSVNPLVVNDDLFTQFPLAGVSDSRWTMRQSASSERNGNYAPLPDLTDDSSEPLGWSPDPGRVFYRDPLEYVWVGTNTTGQELALASNHWPANTVALHPPGTGLVVVTWTAPTAGLAELEFAFTDANAAGLTGQNWYVEKNNSSTTLAQGLLAEGGDSGLLRRTVLVAAGDRINFVVDANGDFSGDTLLLKANVRLQVDAVSVLANDRRDELATLTATLAAAPTHGQVVLFADGGFTYTPNAGYLGADEFTYVVTDGVNQAAPATVQLFVEPKLLGGDVDGNRKVDLSDFGLLKRFFGLDPAFRSQGDLNGDHKVDLTDFGVLKSNFGQSGALRLDAGALPAGVSAFPTDSRTPVDTRTNVFGNAVAQLEMSDLIHDRSFAGPGSLIGASPALAISDNVIGTLGNPGPISVPAVDDTVYLRGDSGNINGLVGCLLGGLAVEPGHKTASDALTPDDDELAAVDAALLDWDA